MADIKTEVLNNLPKDAEISMCNFEAANIILYTKNKDFFLDSKDAIKDVVNLLKKRIELRPDPSITLDMELARDKIKSIVPEEARLSEITFDPQRSQVIIEAEKPGLAIGKAGDVLRQIRKETFWVPLIKRTPAIRSKIIENIRGVLYENSDFRRNFLDQVGKRIYSGWIRGKKEGWVRVSCLGASRQVGRSSFLLQTPESRILLDCGINVAAQGDEMFPHFDAPELKINEIDAVIVSHAHLDHSAMIPLLFKYGYKGPVYCTEPTRDIMALLALDYIGVGHAEAAKPLFSASDVKEMVKHTICLDYEEVSDITPDVRLTFYDAGHILGSAISHLHIGNGLHNFVYTGDLNYETSNLLSAANTKFPRVETIMMESTYGGKDDNPPSRKECENQLISIVKSTLENGGKVLLPVLGVGRSQEIQIILERAIREGLIPKVPVYMQGIVWDVTAIHTAYPDFFNNRVKRSIFHQNNNPFLSEIFKQVGSRKEMQTVIDSGDPCIIMATSGMMVGGASVEYFRAFAENPKHNLIITNYVGPGSLARRLQDGEKEISFQVGENRTETVKVKMGIHTISGFSGHSSRSQLMNYIYRLDPKPKKVLLIHGEVSKCLDLASSIHKANRVETVAPRNLDSLRLR
ncbi:beta-CASP ribonuclease aCPSF1 [Candidatus Woesearchaeota archaeon]|nr:MAG: beta-CASP ribonuclease aCPSF1 [Candidatus Woesearchaeota archaeon]